MRVLYIRGLTDLYLAYDGPVGIAGGSEVMDFREMGERGGYADR